METTARVGRNEPCPCGSGKKYKACCEGRVDVVAEAQRSPWSVVILVVVAIAITGVLVMKFMRPKEEAPATVNTAAPIATPPVTLNTPSMGTLAAPPGPPPPGKVWSAEHGHWHDAPGAGGAPSPVVINPNGVANPAPATPVTAQPPGPAPEGKVWSPEHGHWHDAPAGGQQQQH
ncbi:MAG: SEC-C domain-containing protein [Planctomycetes bacterium]|nr:SEC-C domain-containing protein [Planctomycetota bacterium]